MSRCMAYIKPYNYVHCCWIESLTLIDTSGEYQTVVISLDEPPLVVILALPKNPGECSVSIRMSNLVGMGGLNTGYWV